MHPLARGLPGPPLLNRFGQFRFTSQPLSLLGARKPILSAGLGNQSFLPLKRYLSQQKVPPEQRPTPPRENAESMPPMPLPPGQANRTPVSRENIYTLPNILTFSRLVAAPLVGYFILHDSHAWALALFAYAGVTDFVDGYIARRWNSRTVVGSVIDPMADKCLMVISTVCLAAKGALPVWLAAVIILRDIALGISAIYYRWISLPPPKTLTRYWDFSLPSAEVRPTTISKYNTVLQLGLIGLTMLSPVIAADISAPLTVLQYTVAVTTVWSGSSYIFNKDAVKILHQSGRK